MEDESHLLGYPTREMGENKPSDHTKPHVREGFISSETYDKRNSLYV
jgi:hypothetical protein